MRGYLVLYSAVCAVTRQGFWVCALMLGPRESSLVRPLLVPSSNAERVARRELRLAREAGLGPLEARCGALLSLLMALIESR